ncbi:beta-ketoacyl synthase N-terminal-like domain-containing protein [Acanthopleuribacter pedis]|uniref:Polyketide synthase dehydratase domain-containing protein n=1 Tax=Acanthopleuribacter pedis TaxID=442870 RepID=A0A8J7QEI8_9BACT|nr:beta-ketoacyl synthase N-terminal-like domain-containing protein [Acanthopleuribacter pedis]MBO1322794.1 polyketide synthase dehydratase domain-containing protein [Acanthopleuribacter pedis]
MENKQTPPLVAIVGMACVFPGAADLDQYRDNIFAGKDAVEDVPPHRWDPVYYDPDSKEPDRFYCRRGGFVDQLIDFDPTEFGLMPIAAQGAEPDQLVSLALGARALQDASLDKGDYDPNRAGVIIGRGNYIGAGMTRLEQYVRNSEQLVGAMRSLHPELGDDDLTALRRQFQKKLGHYGPDTAIGLVPNLTASLLANRFNLFGPAYTVDAACASSLMAVDQAVRELQSNRCDLMLAGGIHLSHDVAFWSVFCQLGALSRNQQIRPLDRRADGLVIGEGGGIVALKRLEDAQRDGNRIYAVIRGIGIASDGRAASMMSPAVSGQTLALERAWREAGLDREAIGFLEAHGTGTPTGDEAELTTVRQFFGSEKERHAAIGSVKSMIGHTMPAAGIAGLIKTALAVHAGKLPPTLHCEEPHPLLEDSRFQPLSSAKPWPKHLASQRVAAVNAFGFGGINAHVVLAADPTANPPETRVHETADDKPDAPFIEHYAADSAEALLRDLALGNPSDGNPKTLLRLAIIEPNPARRQRAAKIVERGRAWRGRDNIYFTTKGLAAGGGKLALLFPGVDSAFEPRIDDLAAFFGQTPPSHAKPASVVADLEQVGVGIIQTNRFLFETLNNLAIQPDALAGHSIGEWSALLASGCLPGDKIDAFIDTLKPGTLEVPGVLFLAAGCGADKATPLIADLEEVAISHENCSRQVIFCGREAGIAVLEERLKEQRVLAQRLPFRSGYHSPLFADYLGPHLDFFQNFPMENPAIPMWSATLCAPYPKEINEIRALSTRHLVEPVRFRGLIESMYADNFRIFVQVGTGSLPGFVTDTLGKQPHLAMSANLAKRSGLDQLAHLAAALWVEGVSLDDGMFRVKPDVEPIKKRKSRSFPLPLSVPLVELDTGALRAKLQPLQVESKPKTEPKTPQHPIAQTFRAMLRECEDAGESILQQWETRSATGPVPMPQPVTPQPAAVTFKEAVTTRRLSVQICPELLDHSFFAQRAGWTVVEDRYPVVPMTMSIQMMMDAVRKQIGKHVVVAMEKIRAYKWLVVAEPIELTFTMKQKSATRWSVAIDGYAAAEAVTAPVYPQAPAARPLVHEQPEQPFIDAAGMYRERWMFHGPAYQGILDFDAVSDKGLSCRLKACQGPGSLLDNAGQAFGFWIMERHRLDRLAMPIHIEKLRFYGPDPVVGAELDCRVFITEMHPKEAAADLQLRQDGRVWCEIDNWRDRRFDTDHRLWPVILQTENHLLAQPEEHGFVVFFDKYGSAPSRDYLARRFLTKVERDAYNALKPKGKRQWLNGRIAAKDAVRRHLWRDGQSAIFPAEIRIEGPPTGTVRAVRDDRVFTVVLDTRGELAVAGVFNQALGVALGIRADHTEPARPTQIDELAQRASDHRAAFPDHAPTTPGVAPVAGANTHTHGDRQVAWAASPDPNQQADVEETVLRELLTDTPYIICWTL